MDLWSYDFYFWHFPSENSGELSQVFIHVCVLQCYNADTCAGTQCFLYLPFWQEFWHKGFSNNLFIHGAVFTSIYSPGYLLAGGPTTNTDSVTKLEIRIFCRKYLEVTPPTHHILLTTGYYATLKYYSIMLLTNHSANQKSWFSVSTNQRPHSERAVPIVTLVVNTLNVKRKDLFESWQILTTRNAFVVTLGTPRQRHRFRQGHSNITLASC